MWSSMRVTALRAGPLSRLAPIRSLVCEGLCGSSGSPHGAGRSLFPCSSRRARHPHRLPERSVLGHASVRSPPPQSSFTSNTARHLSARTLLPRVSALSRHHRCASTHARFPTSLRSALRLSQPLGGLLRAPAPRACSIPQPRPGPVRSRTHHPRSRRSLVENRVPPCRCCRLPDQQAGRRSTASRLRGLAPRGVVIPSASDQLVRRLTPSLGFSLLQVLRLRTAGARLPSSVPLMTFCARPPLSPRVLAASPAY